VGAERNQAQISSSENRRRDVDTDRATFCQLVQRAAAESESYVNALGEPHPFISRFLSFIGWSARSLQDFIVERNGQAERGLISGTQTTPRIQKITHKIWLTSTDQPHPPPTDYLDAYFEMCESQPADWTHMFWSNSAVVLQLVSALAVNGGARVFALNIDMMALGPIEGTLRRLIADRKFVLAADVLKFVVLGAYGGIYSDMGFRFDELILQIALQSDCTFLLASNMFFQTSFLSLAKGSLLSSVFLGILNNPEALSIEYAADESKAVTAGTEVHTFCGLGYTACALLFMPPTARIFAFAESSSHKRWTAQQSWYGDKPKFGNVLISDTEPSVLRAEKYQEFASAASQGMRTINADGRLTEMARILFKLCQYFQGSPSRLSKLLSYGGSDKCGGWHNYGYVYSAFLSIFARQGCTLMEVGDAASLWGSTDSGAPSSSGGSIRVWKEYLSASTFGVDIDRALAETFDLSRPVVVNQSERTTIRQELSCRQYDVIIDNGIHSFEASTLLMEAAQDHLAASGLYVVEAVPVTDIDRWEVHLARTKRPAFIMSFPSDVNRQDNCLVLAINSD